MTEQSLYGPVIKSEVCFCAMSAPTTVPPEPCEHTSMQVECSHGRNVLADRYSLLHTQVFEVVAGPKTSLDAITCIAKIVKGPCKTKKSGVAPHEKRVFDFIDQPSGSSDAIKTRTSDVLSFSAASVDMAILETPFDYLWPSHPTVRIYTVTADTCAGPKPPTACLIRVYPDLEWSLKMSLKWLPDDVEYDETAIGNLDGKSKTIKANGFEFAGSVERKYDGVSLSLGLEFTKQAERILKTVSKASRLYKSIASHLEAASAFKLKLKPPSIDELSGTWGWKEISGSPKCGFEFRVKLSIIFIEADFTIDCLKLLIQGLTAGGATALLAAIEQAREKAKKAGTEFAVELKATGKVGLSGEWNLLANQNEDNVAGSPIALDLSLNFTGTSTVELDIEWWRFSASGSAEAGISSGFKGEAKARVYNRSPVIDWKLTWSGISIDVKYETPSVEFSKKISKAEKFKSPENQGAVKKQQETSSGTLKKNSGGVWTLVPEMELENGTWELFDSGN